MKVIGMSKGLGHVSHTVELTEKDLLLLEQMIDFFVSENKAEHEHVKEVDILIKEMLSDY